NRDRPRPRLPRPLAIAVAMVRPLGGPLAMSSASEALDLEIHHAVDDKRHHLPEEIGVGALLNQVSQEHSVDGHGIRLSVGSSFASRTNSESDHDRPSGLVHSRENL